MIRKMFISAGEASGDKIGAVIMNEFRSRGNFVFIGIGGPSMRGANLNCIGNAEDLSATGIVEAIPKALPAIKVLKKGCKILSSGEIEKAIFIDFPEVNLRFLRCAFKKGIPAYYVSPPQVWAWREKRILKLTKCRKVICLFPFEEDYYKSRNINAVYAGNPIIERIKSNGLLEIPKDPFPHIALLPGSRLSEIKMHIDIFIDLIKIIRKENTGLKISMGIADTVDKIFNARYKNLIERYNVNVTNKTLNLLRRCSCAVIVSGTAALESALLDTPAVVIYRMKPISYMIGKKLIKVKFVSLPNILLGFEIFPELIQNEANPENIWEKLRVLVYDSSIKLKSVEKLQTLKEILGKKVFSKSVSDEILND